MGCYALLWVGKVAIGCFGLLWVLWVAMESRATTEAKASFCETISRHSCLSHSPNNKSPPHIEVLLLSSLYRVIARLRTVIASFCEAIASCSCLSHSLNHKSQPHIEVLLLSTLLPSHSHYLAIHISLQESTNFW